MGAVNPVDASTAADIRSVIALHPLALDNWAFGAVGSAYAERAQLGGPTGDTASIDTMRGTMTDVRTYHPHQTSDTMLHQVDDHTVRAWSKYFIIRGDGTAGSGDYLDTIVRGPDGWRITERRISRGSRPDSDPDGPSERVLTFAQWLTA